MVTHGALGYSSLISHLPYLPQTIASLFIGTSGTTLRSHFYSDSSNSVWTSREREREREKADNDVALKDYATCSHSLKAKLIVLVIFACCFYKY